MSVIAFQGERGSFSDEAAQAVFGPDIIALPCREFRQVGLALSEAAAQYAILPVENSIAGSVLPAYDVLAETKASVLAEITRPIRHFVMGTGRSMGDVRRVLSHPVALAQCSKFFQAEPQLEAVAVYDTAGAAREVAGLHDPGIAAIAARTAATLYGLNVLREDVQDRDDNQTRFYVLGPGRASASGADKTKTAMLLETENRPGALVAVLQPFARLGVNLSKLESRPGEVPWTYRFFVEVEGSTDDDAVGSALREVQAAGVKVHVLGSFIVLEPDGRVAGSRESFVSHARAHT